MRGATATATTDIEAPPDLVYGLVSDVAAMAEWAAETDRCEWIGGAVGPAVGARFRGRNRNGRATWSTTCEVTAADLGRRFAFQVHVGPIRTAEWEYAIDETATGCRVTESTRRRVPAIFTGPTNWLLGVKDRDAHNQANIETSLARLKERAEAVRS